MSGVAQPRADLVALEADVLALENEAAGLVADHLGLSADQVRSAASLFDLPGFDSLAVVAVLDGLEERFGREVPPERIVPEAFETLGSLAALFLSAGPAGPNSPEEAAT
ncbi:acyl carrier protein [Streptomyces sp. NPDC091272]|uniref:acyl carrier protein n=1 Tax=Streptomyces sp. NPDC091272 TaxID=3365981 RepID=UPI00381348E7